MISTALMGVVTLILLVYTLVQSAPAKTDVEKEDAKVAAKWTLVFFVIFLITLCCPI